MSEKEKLRKTEWLGMRHKRSSMTLGSDVVMYGDTLWTLWGLSERVNDDCKILRASCASRQGRMRSGRFRLHSRRTAWNPGIRMGVLIQDIDVAGGTLRRAVHCRISRTIKSGTR